MVCRMSCCDRSPTQKSLMSVGRETRCLWLSWGETSGAAGAAPRPWFFPWTYQDKIRFQISRNHIRAFPEKFSIFLQVLFSHSNHWESSSACHNDKSGKEPFLLVKILCRGLGEMVRVRCHGPRVTTLAPPPWQCPSSLTAPRGHSHPFVLTQTHS